MRGSRKEQVAARALLTAILVVAGASSVSGSEAARHLIDPDGVVHVTNRPADPRYRRLPGASGTAAGWLQLEERPSERYAVEIQEISRQHGVDPALVEAVVREESGFNPRAVSPKGAAGLMQLMPRTAFALGVVDRFDPRGNIQGGVQHLRYLLERYRGSVVMAVAAYNAGERAVDAYGGIPPYPETQHYVERVLRRVGSTESLGSADAIYRYPGPDDTLIYSNLPPVHRHPSARPAAR